MIVMDETSCMVDVAQFFMEFCMDESCGKCVPCRVGTAQMHDSCRQITMGEATARDLALLEELCDLVKATSLCGLGQTAPNPVLSTLRYFRDEYESKIAAGEAAAAGVCHAGGRCRVSSRPSAKPTAPAPSSKVKTLKIDDRVVCAREDETDPRGGPRERHPHPDALPPRRPDAVGRLPPLPGRGEGLAKLLPPA